MNTGPAAAPRKILRESEVDRDPVRQLNSWLEAARAAGIHEPLAMTLATARADGTPSARVVLLRGLDERGLTFFTNYQSRKGVELAQNPQAALLFYWGELERQVRVEGRVELTTAAESDAYFATRPAGSRRGAWASPQSQVIPGRDFLERGMETIAVQYPGDAVPRPEHWGGYRVIPHTFEFWQGQPDRLHDRLRYRRTSEGRWAVERLAP